MIKQDSNHAIALIMFYENRKSLIFKVLGIVSITSLENVCVLIICVFKEKQSCHYYTEDFKILHLMSS